MASTVDHRAYLHRVSGFCRRNEQLSARIQNAKSGLTSSREEKQILKELGEEFKQIKKLFREVVRVLKMGPFKADQPLIIVLGCQTTLVQLGFGEVYTPAKLRFPTRMFPGIKPRTFEPVKILKRKKRSDGENINGDVDGGGEESYVEDPTSDEGAIYPIQDGRVVNAGCLMALLKHIHNTVSPPFNTPVLLVTQPGFSDFEYELLTSYCFQQWTVPAFTLVDAAIATQYGYGSATCLIVDVGYTKTDITAIVEHELIHTGRVIGLLDTGGEAMTKRLFELLGPKGFTKDMCEQLKRSGICEVLPPGVPLPSEKNPSDNSTVAISGPSGANGFNTGQRASISGQGGVANGARNQDEAKDKEDNEGVLDVASIVASGKTNEFLAKRERDKAEKAASRKAAAEAAAAPKAKLQNAQRVKAVFHYDVSSTEEPANATALHQGSASDQTSPTDASAPQLGSKSKGRDGVENGTVRRSIEVGVERFQAADNGILERIADGVHRVILDVHPSNLRSDLWDSLIITGNATRVKGFKEALFETLSARYLISPSSATIFTSELPSALSTPLATGANTPNPLTHTNSHSGVNPMLLAATTASTTSLAPPNAQPQRPAQHSGHAQTPTSIKLLKAPDYLSEFKDDGSEELIFAGAQEAAYTFFVNPAAYGVENQHMTRVDYNAMGPKAIRQFSML